MEDLVKDGGVDGGIVSVIDTVAVIAKDTEVGTWGGRLLVGSRVAKGKGSGGGGGRW